MENAAKEFTMSTVFAGMSILGESFQDVEVMSIVLTGHFDRDIGAALYYRHFNKLPANDTDLSDTYVVFALNRLKDMHRATVHEIFRDAEKEEAEMARIKRMQCLSAQHRLGTTAEIAAKYNLSKSEVRRRKADGSLEQLINGDAMMNSLKEAP